MEKTKLILDTDISNEVDDQFALVYLVKSLNFEDIEAITIAPFSNSGYAQTNSASEGTELSFITACKVLDLIDAGELKSKVIKGAEAYFNESRQTNPAVQKIIECARNNQKTTILAIGAITNVALALEHAPDIATKIKVIWLGGNSFLSERNDEFNFKQDVEAVKKVFYSKVDLTVIPCKNVASLLSISVYELKHYIQDKGNIGKYLCEIFENCKRFYRKNPIDEIGENKVLWDLSVIAFFIHPEWFETKAVKCPKICDDLSYKKKFTRRKIKFVLNMSRHKIYQDFFLKLGSEGN